MTVPELSVELRDQAGKGAARKLRSKGLIPAVLYGEGKPAAGLTVDPQALKKILAQESAKHFLVNLKIEGKMQRAMLKEIQMDPVSRQLLHADFLTVRMDQAVTIDVALEFKGEPVGVDEGGVLEIRSQYISVTALPDKLPHSIEVDVSGLKIGHSIKVESLGLGDGLTVETHPETVLAAVSVPSLVEVEEELEEVAEGLEEEDAAAGESGEED